MDRLVAVAPLYTAPGTSGLPKLLAETRAESSLPQLIVGGPEAEFLQANTPDAVICGGGGLIPTHARGQH